MCPSWTLVVRCGQQLWHSDTTWYEYLKGSVFHRIPKSPWDSGSPWGTGAYSCVGCCFWTDSTKSGRKIFKLANNQLLNFTWRMPGSGGGNDSLHTVIYYGNVVILLLFRIILSTKWCRVMVRVLLPDDDLKFSCPYSGHLEVHSLHIWKLNALKGLLLS